jgi:hypothetical protein
MADKSEEAYATAVGRSMWRMAKRRAFALLKPNSEVVEVTRAAFPGAPENKSLPHAALPSQGAPSATKAPQSLREFLRRLGEELEQGDPPRAAS